MIIQYTIFVFSVVKVNFIFGYNQMCRSSYDINIVETIRSGLKTSKRGKALIKPLR